MTKPFASSGDLQAKQENLEVLADGVYALTTGGDPNVAAIEGEDFLVCFEARATPVMARQWLDRLREYTDKPVRYLVLSHYHAVRVLGASAFDAQEIITHTETRRLIAERGQQDWEVEMGRMPRLFEGQETIPGLTRPTLTFDDHMSIDLGGDRGSLELSWLGRGHTSGDIVAWLPNQRILFTGDLVENGSAVYTGDAYHQEWSTVTLDRVAQLGAEITVGGRGDLARSAKESLDAIAMTRDFIRTLLDETRRVQLAGGSVKDAYRACYDALKPQYGSMPVFEHALVFDAQRVWEEVSGEKPQIWTVQRDHEIWDQLTT
jgi:glyoxylase-like metal-dependent hydrolase (beta-lactamase superfamily II)